MMGVGKVRRELRRMHSIDPLIRENLMAQKSDFASDEWTRVVASPMVAAMAITAADPSGLWGLLKEAISSGWSLLEIKQDATANPLAKAVADDMGDPTTRSAARDRMQAQFKGAPVADIKTRAIEELAAVAALVVAKAPQDADGFKAWLQQVAQKAAEAGTEGGFLGFGGVAVSDKEKATLSEIAAALGREGMA